MGPADFVTLIFKLKYNDIMQQMQTQAHTYYRYGLVIVIIVKQIECAHFKITNIIEG